MFLSCLKATELIEKKIQFKLTFSERLRLSVHKAMCSACTNYEKQDYFIEKAISNRENFEPQKIMLDTNKFKKSIIEKIEK